MIGAIVGDIIGSAYEFDNVRKTDFELFTTRTTFTDDTVMTLAVAEWLMTDETHVHETLVECMHRIGRKHPDCGYGGMFYHWMMTEEHPRPYNSFGNGSGMRVSPVGLYAGTLDEALQLAKISAEVSHNHPEGIKGAQSIAGAMWMSRNGQSKADIKHWVEETFGYDLDRTIAEIRPTYRFNETCQKSVPEAIIAFLEGTDFEQVIRLAVSIGGDSDTIAAMAGGIAACQYPIDPRLAQHCENCLTEDLKDILHRFEQFIRERG